MSSDDYGSGYVSKRSPLRLDAIRDEASTPDPSPALFPSPTESTVHSSAGPEPTSTIYARVPWALGEELRDLARRRSRQEGRRVTVNDLVVEALRQILA